MAVNVPIYPGSSSFTTGSTPFGFYDSDVDFQIDADKVAFFCAQRLGWPILEVELQDKNFYAAFETAVTTYGNEIYAYKLRDNLLSLEGASTSSNLNTAQITPGLSSLIKLTQQYASEAGVGGNINWYSGSVDLVQGVQDYDLSQWAVSNGISGSIEIKRIFHYGVPDLEISAQSSSSIAIPYTMAYDYILLPVSSYTMQMLQAIEMSNTIKRSNYSFELINNKLRLFPIPEGETKKIWFQYIKTNERIEGAIVSSPDKITNVSNAGYHNPTYLQINSIGRSWIFEYTLALCKEMLGLIRGKYQTIPIPNSDATLNYGDLLTQASNEKEKLIERLRTYLDETSRKALLERRKDEVDYLTQEINRVPLPIYIG